MKYYSTELKKLFDSEEELLKAEKTQADLAKAKEKAEMLKKKERTEKAKEVEEAFRLAKEAQSKAYKTLEEFNKAYGPYHKSYFIDGEDTDDVPFDFFNSLLRFLG